MINFLQCGMCIFGDKGKYSISYKLNEPGFKIFRAKYVQDFKVQVNARNFEGALGQPIDGVDHFFVADDG